MMGKHIEFLSDLSRQVENENVFEKKKFVRYWTLFFRIYGWFLCSLCHSFWPGCWRKDKNIDTREACWVSAIVSGHGGIGEEDRVLSCLPVHVLCFQNCSHFVVVIRTLSCCLSYGLWMHNITWLVCLFACWRFHRDCQCFYPLSCLGLIRLPYWLITRLTTWSQFDRRRDLILIEIIMPFDFHAVWFLIFLLCSSEGGSVSVVMASASSSIKGRSSCSRSFAGDRLQFTNNKFGST